MSLMTVVSTWGASVWEMMFCCVVFKRVAFSAAVVDP